MTWIKDSGAEFALAELADRDGGPDGSWLRATGTAVGADPLPYRLEYELDCGEDFVTRELDVSASGDGWAQRLQLSRDAGGRWQMSIFSSGLAGVQEAGEVLLEVPGGDLAALGMTFGGALDCDLGLSPLTNTMPVLRHRLLTGGGPQIFQMAWVSVPDLSVQLSRQSYEFIRRDPGTGHSVVRFASDGFQADIVFDSSGFVVDYPGIGRRLP
jgi:hypothetical protein